MGFLDIFKRKNKFDKISRTEVVDSIIQLEKQQDSILSSIEENNAAVAGLFAKGKAEKDTNMRVFYAKNIENLKKNNITNGKRLQFIATNMSAMYQLKSAMDDREFLANNANVSLNEMLKQPAQLSKFLNSVNAMKMNSEGSLENVLETFDMAESGYVENDSIYGSSEGQQDILAMFDEQAISDDMVAFNDVALTADKEKIEEPIENI